MADRLVKVKTYAAYLGVSRQRVYRMIFEGKLDATKIDDVVFIKLKPINQFLDKAK